MKAAHRTGWQIHGNREGKDGNPFTLGPGARIALTTLRHTLHRFSRPQQFIARELPPCTLSRLLWSAAGSAAGGAGRVGSDGGVDVYLALASGLYRFDAVRIRLHPLSAADIRCQFSIFDCVPLAPLNLVYVSRVDRRAGMRRQHAAALATIRTAALCENVDRFCAIEGMATTVRGWLDRPSLLDSLGLQSDEQLLLVQSVGYVANAGDDRPNALDAAA